MKSQFEQKATIVCHLNILLHDIMGLLLLNIYIALNSYYSHQRSLISIVFNVLFFNEYLQIPFIFQFLFENNMLSDFHIKILCYYWSEFSLDRKIVIQIFHEPNEQIFST